ncbi:MAG: hypothetical protein OES57_08210 [Acidimicrobiia bacterium]|nr:hypothetical protein [Acidimicrobiia bacterium]
MSGHDRLSAYLDDELASHERGPVEAELAADPDLVAELEAARAARELVRGLGPVEPPSNFVFEPAPTDAGAGDDRTADDGADVIALASRRRARPWLLGVAAATIFFLVLGFASGTRVADVVPPVDRLVDEHASAAAAMPDAPPMPDDEAAAIDDMGPDMPAMPMVASYTFSDGITQLVYETDQGFVSVFRQDGQLDSAGLPPGAQSMAMETGTAMVLPAADDTDVVVIERDDVVFTVVGQSDDHDMVMAMADSVPATDRGLLDDIRRWFGRLA